MKYSIRESTERSLIVAEQAVKLARETFESDNNDDVTVHLQLIGGIVQRPPDGENLIFESSGESTTIIVITTRLDKIIV